MNKDGGNIETYEREVCIKIFQHWKYDQIYEYGQI
jgi:hypothetical protein